MYPMRSRLVALGNNEVADQMITQQIDEMRVGGGSMTVGTMKQLMAAKKAKEEQAKREAADLTNADNSLGHNDPAFKAAKAAYQSAQEALKAAQKNWVDKAALQNKCKRWEVLYRRGDRRSLDPAKYCGGPNPPNDCVCRERGNQEPDEKIAARDRLRAAEQAEQNAKQVLKVAAQAAMNRLSAFYPYKGFIIKPKLTSDYQWFRFDVQSNRTSNVLTTAERILEAQAWIDREVAREQERDLKIYDEARSSAVSTSRKAAIKALEAQNQAFTSLVAKKQAAVQADEQGDKKARNLLIIGALAAGGFILLKGGG